MQLFGPTVLTPYNLFIIFICLLTWHMHGNHQSIQSLVPQILTSFQQHSQRYGRYTPLSRVGHTKPLSVWYHLSPDIGADKVKWVVRVVWKHICVCEHKTEQVCYQHSQCHLELNWKTTKIQSILVIVNGNMLFIRNTCTRKFWLYHCS